MYHKTVKIFVKLSKSGKFAVLELFLIFLHYGLVQGKYSFPTLNLLNVNKKKQKDVNFR